MRAGVRSPQQGVPAARRRSGRWSPATSPRLLAGSIRTSRCSTPFARCATVFRRWRTRRALDDHPRPTPLQELQKVWASSAPLDCNNPEGYSVSPGGRRALGHREAATSWQDWLDLALEVTGWRVAVPL